MSQVVKDTYENAGDFVYWSPSPNAKRRAIARSHPDDGYHLHLQTLLPKKAADGERWETAPDIISAATIEDADIKATAWVSAGSETS